MHTEPFNYTLSNIIVIVTMRLDLYKYYTTLLYVVYNSGQVLQCKTSMSNIYIYNLILLHTIGIFDLLDLSIVNISDNSLCLQYNFIIGSQTCLVHRYIEDTTTILHYDIPHHNMLYFNHCIIVMYLTYCFIFF